MNDPLEAWTDEQLLAATGAVQEAAWAVLMNRYTKSACQHIRRKLPSARNDAEDLVQHVWMQIFQWVQKGYVIHRFGPFFWRLVGCRLIDYHRSAKAKKVSCILDAQVKLNAGTLYEEYGSLGKANRHVFYGVISDFDQNLISFEDRMLLEKGLERLSARDRWLVLARTQNGYSMRGAAQYMVNTGLMAPGGNEEKRAENYYYRALDQLRRYLEPELRVC